MSRLSSHDGLWRKPDVASQGLRLFGPDVPVVEDPATRIRANEARAAVNATAGGAAIVAPPGLNRLDLGTLLAGVVLNGYLQRIDIFGDTTDSQLQRLTT